MSNDLCKELIAEIFSRLPIKSLLRFRSLSKSFHILIGSPGFIRLHTLRSPKSFLIIHRVRFEGEANAISRYTMHGQLSYIGLTPLEYPFQTLGSIYTMHSIVGSCNGILCVYEDKTDSIHLWNPCIRRKLTVPVPVHVPDLPSQGPCLGHGFGFDPVSDDYKILRIYTAGSFAYTIKTRTWRRIANSPTVNHVNQCQCIFNGALHWVVNGIGCCYILTFDLSSEVFSTIELPEQSRNDTQVTIIKGSLAVIYEYCRIRVYNHTAASWSRSLELDTHQVGGAGKGILHSTHGHLLFRTYCKGIHVYNPETEVLMRLAALSDSSYTAGVVTCNESLGLLDLGTACDQGTQRIIVNNEIMDAKIYWRFKLHQLYSRP